MVEIPVETDVQTDAVQNGINGNGSSQIAFLTTGGSIDKTYSPFTSSFEIEDPRPLIRGILRDGLVRFKYFIKPILKKDSLEMTDVDRKAIRDEVEACTQKRIIITHGTDTIVETGQFLSGIPKKTIVLTGAFRPARSKGTDAILNLGMAIAAVQILPAGTYVAINGKISPVCAVRKDRERQVFRFSNGNGHAKAHAAVPSRHK
ncbi:MAG TPA: asparaginase domain-containing protein [Pyrinomonadaceae bacterium]|nr:asparaginase domain-containing protein [Pyrinomonadaceae bacterium]